MRRIIAILLAAFLFLIPSFVSASEVILKSGQKLEGKITEQTDKYLKIDTGIGVSVTYYSDEIDTVDGQSLKAVQVPAAQTPSPVTTSEVILKSGQIIEGKIVRKTNQFIRIDPGNGIRMTYFADEIATINGKKFPISKHHAKKLTSTNNEIPLSVINTPVQAILKPDTVSLQDKAPEVTQALPDGNTSAQGQIQGRTVTQPKFDALVNKSSGQLTMKFVNRGRQNLNIFEKIAFLASMGAFGIAMIIVPIIIFAVFPAFCLYFISKKTNRGVAWMAFVPIANCFLMCKIAGIRYIWLFLLLAGFIPFLGIIAIYGLFIYIWYLIALALNKPGWWGILTIVPIVGIVAIAYLAFSDK